MGADLSPKAASRAVAEASARGVTLPTFAADMRSLPFADASFDVVLAADNALPHLLTAQDVLAALREMRRVAPSRRPAPPFDARLRRDPE
ncbi:class I SAM-dependent methyltransferase [Lentzea flaviverrucosa]|uniref:class I SAM-dependent methyltransferase n=1 Tax=Lentzea flaviverrucosa TaxID=200379 RepID=UPI001B86CEE4|nr:class I SAM-dependent methyltransferase [Lentzea flaviverrucosa]